MPAGTVSVAAGANAYEGGAAGGFDLYRTDTTAGQSVNFSFGGTASSSDYAPPMMAYFDVGQASITLTIPAADDSIAEPTETIVFTLTPGADYTVGASGSATIDLIDNDPAAPPLVGIAALGVATAGGPAGTFRITRADPTGPLTVNYVALTTAGGVSSAVPASVSFTAGQAWADLVVTPTEGADPAQMIAVTITLTPGTGYAVGPAGMATLNLYANEVSVQAIADAYEGGCGRRVPAHAHGRPEPEPERLDYGRRHRDAAHGLRRAAADPHLRAGAGHR